MNAAITSAGLVTRSSEPAPGRCLPAHRSQEQCQPHVPLAILLPPPPCSSCSPTPSTAATMTPRVSSCLLAALPRIPVPGRCWVSAGEVSSTGLPHPSSARPNPPPTPESMLLICQHYYPELVLIAAQCLEHPSQGEGCVSINCLFLALTVPHRERRGEGSVHSVPGPAPSSGCFRTCSTSRSALGGSSPLGKGFLEQQLHFSH